MSLRRPNILFVMADDHAAQALSCYGSEINETPNIDRIAHEGARLDSVFCTNAICTPSRATILTGKYSHRNGVYTLADAFDARQQAVPELLRQAGYQTAIVGKWHLGHGGNSDPVGFDHWEVLPGQGVYHNPEFLTSNGSHTRPGYVTDIITDLGLEWMQQRDGDRPFALFCHHKAPHSPWDPDAAHAELFPDKVREPTTFDDDYAGRPAPAAALQNHIENIPRRHLKTDPPSGLSTQDLKRWKYQDYIRNYLRCVASIDDNIGRMLAYLDEEGLAKDTMVIYTSDQGMFLSEHGLYDKRFMYEESLRMPLLVRYPGQIRAGHIVSEIATNVDFAPTILDYAATDMPEDLQGFSLRSLLEGHVPRDWQQSMYYRYWMHLDHGVWAHYGVRTHRYKLIYYYAEALGKSGTINEPRPRVWEMYDLQEDPLELHNVYDDPAYRGTVSELKAEMNRLRERIGDME